MMAERVGFEPTLEFPLNTLSKRAPSATRPPLQARLLANFQFNTSRAVEFRPDRLPAANNSNSFISLATSLSSVRAREIRLALECTQTRFGVEVRK
jgi:hypothetical protein